ncbi:MAG: transcriptional repressor NrdR [Alphaproteobacteria bacterium]|nr:transcriptional repressor NrdR [Alphaproteobacteria bacterium]
MRCPDCAHEESRVVDSRTTGDSIRRRRQCASCGARFTTHERIEQRLPWILKRDGRRELYDREKVLHGITLACRKRPLGPGDIEAAALRVESRLEGTVECSTREVGDAVMAVLREMDPVAYVRFASVYQQFESVQQFVDAIDPLREDG